MLRKHFTQEGHTYQLPSILRYSLDTLHGFHVDSVADRQLGDPDGTQEVRPVSSRRLLECAPFAGTEKTGLRDGA